VSPERIATRELSPYDAASSKARLSCLRVMSLTAGLSSQSMRSSGASTVTSGHSRFVESPMETRAMSPEVS